MASVTFDSVIKTTPLGIWYIEIRDPEEDRVEICHSIEEYAEKIEDMGAEYGGDVEVAWSAEEDVTKEQINEVRMQMNAYQQKLEDESIVPGTGNERMQEEDGSPKF